MDEAEGSISDFLERFVTDLTLMQRRYQEAVDSRWHQVSMNTQQLIDNDQLLFQRIAALEKKLDDVRKQCQADNERPIQ